MILFPSKKVKESGLLENFIEFFDEKNLEEIAYKTKFIQRSSSTLTGKSFLAMNVFEQESLLNTSLNDSCEFLESEFGIELRKQSLDERYNTYAVRFMKQCLAEILNNVMIKSTNVTSYGDIFGRIRIGDSTSFQLPPNLSAFYESAGGDTSSSSIKIQYEYDLVTGEFLDLQLGCGKKNDALFLEKCQPIRAKDLIIRDLGYYQHRYFKYVIDNGGYFLSRFKSGANLYQLNKEGDFEKVELVDLLAKVKSLCSVNLWLGEEKLPVRVVLSPVGLKDAQKRIKKLHKSAKKKKWNVSEERKLMCSFNIFITNIEDSITDESICLLYKLRWQIEILFKIWKSLFKIHDIGHTNIFRFECYIYGRLIALCLVQNIQNIFKEYLMTKGFELSEWKVSKLIKKKCKSCLKPLAKGT